MISLIFSYTIEKQTVNVNERQVIEWESIFKFNQLLNVVDLVILLL